jgi:hypothetical protein
VRHDVEQAVTTITALPLLHAAKAFTSPGVSSTASGMPCTRTRATSGNAATSSCMRVAVRRRSQPMSVFVIGSCAPTTEGTGACGAGAAAGGA